jgi:hypothetical protein
LTATTTEREQEEHKMAYGRMLMKEGAHTGNLPGRVLRNSRYQATHG